ncbi:hypothetical protein HZC31_01125 [Candidatus Woesearchaeota archaeon]|nr:hypothetical protein [Candidatus Woesearchaeota archaeon]
MKEKIVLKGFLFFLTILFFSSFVFAIQGSDSSGTVTSYSGTTGAAAASGSSSDSAVSGGRVSAGGSAVSSAYSDGTISGSPGADLSTTDTSTSSEGGSESGSGTETESGSLNSIPSGGGGGGAGPTAEAATESAEAATEQTTVEAEAQAAAEAATETTAPAENAVTIAIELSAGDSVTLAPQTGAAGMSVIAVTDTTATIVITSDSAGNAITGGAIYQAEQEVTMEVGQTIDVDSDNDGIADLQVTLTQINYNSEAGKYEGIFTLTYLNPTEEIVSFVKEQIDRGEVAFVKGPSEEEISFAYWIWILVAFIVISVLTLVGWVLFDKKNKKHFPTTIPTHYFEKLMRQEVGTHKKPEEQKKEITQIEVKKENNVGKEQPIGTQTILSEIKQPKKKKGKRKKNKKAAKIKRSKKAKNKRKKV